MMTAEEANETARLKAEAVSLAEALHTILSETQEGEVARIALAALTSSETGRRYLDANPFRF